MAKTDHLPHQIMIVGIDNISPGISTSNRTIGGMRNYMQDVLEYLPAARRNWRFKFLTPDWGTPFDVEHPNLERVVLKGVPTNRVLRVVYEQLILPGHIRRAGVDVWIGTHNMIPLRAPCKTIVVAQSLQYFTQASLYPFLQRVYLQSLAPSSMRKADHIIALSEVSRDEIASRFGVPRSRIHVIHHGLQAQMRTVGTGPEPDSAIVRRITGNDDPFVLSVSALYLYKNFHRLIEALARIRAEFPRHKLVIVGGDSAVLKRKDLKSFAEKHGVGDQVLPVGRVGAEDLAALYRSAHAMALPSLDETFGLTVLEAMHFGAPVVTSRASSMAEVGADAVAIVDPLSVESIAAALGGVLRDPERRARMSAAGRARAAQFTPERMVEKMVGVLELLAGHPEAVEHAVK